MGESMLPTKKEPFVVPPEYAGLWIAWDRTHSRIVASGPTFGAAYDAAIEAGEPDPVVGKAPDSDIFFIGSSR